MIESDIPGFGKIRLKHVVFDYNGTIAVDGHLIPAAKDLLKTLSKDLVVHVITADTFGTVRQQLSHIPCKVVILPQQEQHIEKLNYIRKTGLNETVCFGNGRNDRLMLKMAAIGIAVIQPEGASTEAIAAADIVVNNITDGLEILIKLLRLKATLRS
ncbi:HAD hydrolase family protein [candidate division KSB1 bacterium]|nr:HAD hydrolase family protein [candidate division KSB1 bacterium]